MKIFKIMLLFCSAFALAEPKDYIEPLFLLEQNNGEICQKLLQIDADDTSMKLEWDALANSYYLHCETGNTAEDNVIFLVNFDKANAEIYQKQDVTTITRVFNKLEGEYRSDNSWFDSPFCEAQSIDNGKLVFITKIPSGNSKSPYCYSVEEANIVSEDKIDSNSNEYRVISSYIITVEKQKYLEQLNYYLSYLNLYGDSLPLSLKTLISHNVNEYNISKEERDLYIKIMNKWLEKGYIDDANWLNNFIK